MITVWPKVSSILIILSLGFGLDTWIWPQDSLQILRSKGSQGTQEMPWPQGSHWVIRISPHRIRIALQGSQEVSWKMARDNRPFKLRLILSGNYLSFSPYLKKIKFLISRHPEGSTNQALFKLFLLQKFMNIDGTTLFFFKTIPFG